MKLNILKLAHLARPRTHEGAPAAIITPEQALRRSVLACMLWENEFYEDGVAIAGRIRELVPKVEAEKVAALAVEARTAMKLRHAPLLLVREMARHATHRVLVAETLVRVIQRADELSEFVAIYWAEGRRPLSAQVKKGLAAAFTNFDEYALAKYDRASVVRLRDVLFLSHAKPRDKAQAELWKRLIAGELATPDTWEVALSVRWRQARTLGAVAHRAQARRTRTPAQPSQHEGRRRARGAGRSALDAMRTDRVLPFRFLAAARHAPQLEEALERAMFRSLEGTERLAGHTVILVDVSGSMVAPLSRRSQMLRTDAAYGLAVLLREIAEKATVYTFSNVAKRIPPRRGFALRDAMESSQPHRRPIWALPSSIDERYDRIIVITDEQSHDRIGAPRGKGYVINVASARNGVGYGPWVHIDGFSEAVIDYIRELEHTEQR